MQLLIHVVLFFATALCKNNGSQVKSEELFTVPDPNSLDSNNKNQVPINQDDPPTGTESIKGAAKYSTPSPIKESPKILKNTLDDDTGEINNGVPSGKDNVKQFDTKRNQNKDKKDMEKVETAAATPAKVETAAASPEIVETAEATPEKAETSAATPEKAETSTATPEFICSLLWPECTDPHNATKEVPTQLIKFTLNMYKELSKRDETSNLVISPISIALGLSQLMLGSSGETRKLMLKILYGGMENPQCVHHVLQNLTNSQSFSSASEIFFNKDFSIKEEFSNQSERFYGSKGIQLRKNTKKNLVRINEWVSTVTKNLIPSLFKQLPDFELMLLSVIYYQGKWINEFDPNLTKKENFKTASSRSVKVPMMNNHKFPLQSIRDAHLKAQVARFPLSNNYSFIIFLPISQEKGLQYVESQLTDEILNVLITQLKDKSPLATTIAIPQLKLDSEFGLSEILKLLGLVDLFESPQFCALSDVSDLAISDVHHRAILEIKESGVKAAAATSISVARTMPVFLAQKPFLYILVNDINKIPIVIGRVTDPSK